MEEDIVLVVRSALKVNRAHANAICMCEITIFPLPRESRRVAGREWTLGRPVPALAPTDDGHWGCPLRGWERVRGIIIIIPVLG